MQELNIAFEYQKANRPVLPRPGTHVRIEFASEERLSRIPRPLFNDFVDRVLEMEWVIMTDESSLWDFHCDETNDVYLDKIKTVFGLDVSNMPNANVAAILERIAERRET